MTEENASAMLLEEERMSENDVAVEKTRDEFQVRIPKSIHREQQVSEVLGQLRSAGDNPNVKKITILFDNCSGGEPGLADQIASAIRNSSKETVGYIPAGSYAASGALDIFSACSERVMHASAFLVPHVSEAVGEAAGIREIIKDTRRSLWSTLLRSVRLARYTKRLENLLGLVISNKKRINANEALRRNLATKVEGTVLESSQKPETPHQIHGVQNSTRKSLLSSLKGFFGAS